MSIGTSAAGAAQGIRSGKFRHIYGDLWKPDKHYKGFIKPYVSGESNYISCNAKYFSVLKDAGGGPVFIHSIKNTGKVGVKPPVLAVHKGKTLDSDFNPFHSNVIATVSEDCSLCISKFPHGGLTENIKDPLLRMKGHQKKVTLCKFNPCADNIIGTASMDGTVKIWDVSSGKVVNDIKGFGSNIFSLEWNKNGSNIVTTDRNSNGTSSTKKLKIFDPRVDQSILETDGFDGAKSSKAFWMPNLGWVGAVGFNKQARRCIKLWDKRKIDSCLFNYTIKDQSSSVLQPIYDNDLGLLFMYGKGESMLRWYEIINDNKKIYYLNSYRAKHQNKGGCFMPKKGVNVMKCEIMRFLGLTQSDVVPYSLIVPRKGAGDIFQDDLFPDCYAGKIALNSNDWLNGDDKEPITMSLNPDIRVNIDDDDDVYDDDNKEYSIDITNNNTDNNDLLKDNIKLKNENKFLKKELNAIKNEYSELKRKYDTLLNDVINNLKTEAKNNKNNAKNNSTTKQNGNSNNESKSNNNDTNNDINNDDDTDPVSKFLKKLGLDSYIDTIIDEGFDDMETLCELTNDNLSSLGFKVGDKRKLLNAIKKYKNTINK